MGERKQIIYLWTVRFTCLYILQSILIFRLERMCTEEKFIRLFIPKLTEIHEEVVALVSFHPHLIHFQRNKIRNFSLATTRNRTRHGTDQTSARNAIVITSFIHSACLITSFVRVVKEARSTHETNWMKERMHMHQEKVRGHKSLHRVWVGSVVSSQIVIYWPKVWSSKLFERLLLPGNITE